MRIERARKGWTIRTAEGRYLASRVDPEREAERIAASEGIREGETVLLLAPALPYLVRAALARVGAAGRVVVIEPRAEAEALWREAAREDPLLGRDCDDPRVEWIRPASPQAGAEALRGLAHGRVIAPPSAYEVPPPGWEFLAATGRDLASRRASTERFGALLARNREENAGACAAAAPVSRLAGRWRGATAVVAGAGPSLEAAAAHLPRGGAIVAVGTATAPLLSAGIRPSVAVLTDPLPEAALQVATARAQGYDGAWVFFPTVSPSAFSEAARVYLAYPKGEGPAPEEELPAGGTVATTAIGLALLLGAGEVQLFGVDLAVPDTGGSHTRGSFYEIEALASISRFRNFEQAERTPTDLLRRERGERLPAADGGESVFSPQPYPVYLRSIERMLTRSGAVRFVQTAGRGARIRGAAYESPERAAARISPAEGL